MTFWSNDVGMEPIRKRNFIVYIAGRGVGHLVKSVTTPSVETDVGEFRLINQIVKMPTINKWADVSIKFIDTTNIGLSDILINDTFYNQTKAPDSSNPREMGRKKDDNLSMHIDVLDADGQRIYAWTLHNPFIRSINQGELSYSADDFMEVEVIVAYDYATMISDVGSAAIVTAEES